MSLRAFSRAVSTQKALPFGRFRPSAAMVIPYSEQDRSGQHRYMQSPAVKRYNKKHKEPSAEVAKSMPISVSEIGNDTLIAMAAMGNHRAREERLKRHIMDVDDVNYEEANKTFEQIATANRSQTLVNLGVYPYYVGIGLGAVAAFGSIPMVFDYNTTLWFNEAYVTTDVPEPRDLETWLEVGAWSWNWMEPPLGALSFSLLCLQYARAQIQNLGLHPYTDRLREIRANKLAEGFPQYDPIMVKQFSKSDPLVKGIFFKSHRS